MARNWYPLTPPTKNHQALGLEEGPKGRPTAQAGSTVTEVSAKHRGISFVQHGDISKSG